MSTEKSPTIAEHVSALLGDDGSRFDTQDGQRLSALCVARDASVTYGRIVQSEDGDYSVTEVASSEHRADHPVRYAFPDGSAIVIAGAGWDIEGSAPFSWRGA